MIGSSSTSKARVDVHVHSGARPFPADCRRRRGGAARGFARTAGTVAEVPFRAHHQPGLSDRAARARDPVIGGIVLNRAVGGINPAAVESALQLGAKHVWMPTVDAATTPARFGSTGVYDKQASHDGQRRRHGIEVFDSDG